MVLNSMTQICARRTFGSQTFRHGSFGSGLRSSNLTDVQLFSHHDRLGRPVGICYNPETSAPLMSIRHLATSWPAAAMTEAGSSDLSVGVRGVTPRR